MPAGLPVAILMLADVAAASAPPPAKPPERDCAASTDPKTGPNADPNTGPIVICAPKFQGYRLDPDVMEAKREKRSGGRPHNPHETYADHSCATVGPMGCRGGPMINLLAAAATAAEMADRLSKGEEIGSMFKTEPTPTEYQLYVEAKKRREAKEAEAAAAAKAKADAAKTAAVAAAEPVKPEATPAH